MPVKVRTAKGRKPVFSDQILDLFLSLERKPRQRDEEYRARSHRLAVLLDLTDEWLMQKNVNDRSRGPCHPPYMLAHAAWHKCREVRLQLLAAIEDRACHRKERTEASP